MSKEKGMLDVSISLGYTEAIDNSLTYEKAQYKITEYIENNFYGKFEIEPLERGFGTTLGNALRRVMLSSLPGDAIRSVSIEGAMHEFQTIDGIVEDVAAIILNLKKVVVKKNTEEDVIIKVSTKGEGILTILSRKDAIDYAEAKLVDETPLADDATLRDVLKIRHGKSKYSQRKKTFL